ncbi:RhoGAP domain-containing protein [Dictyostelium discoideum AX4]|uniref:Rho GTPase-activating protein gacT n=2 Tax=Dictyostelium discoideum TaxID=44689 RepID=GACT_DICDI|nr:RhoGAP domain-containing protein [Dictyostelium discoideum AX4]Q54NL0.1 RecName: Full=Rho GTPase-activating protein gacT; AltName: Full=GTPase activating factor for raC protein T [Dictyostelium discoideum]EAL64838.1 RhoGAP domain-containing protein [Dictyostelium discoideum AX4]|eukprot:XP_638352.1 RhoGAP domain-containing protein [Dictyostelium discoideum AX4]
MKNIFRRSVQIFHKDKKEGDKQDYTGSSGSSGNSGTDRSPTSSLSKKDKKHSKHHQNESYSGDNSPTLSRNHHDEIGHLQYTANHHIATSHHSHSHNHNHNHNHQLTQPIQQQQQTQHVNLASNNYYIRHIYTNNQYDETTQIVMNNGIPFIYNPNARKIFGVPLTQVPCRAGSNVPIIIEKLIDHIERTSLNSEGLFRIPGVDLTINQYIKLFDNGEDVDVSPIEPYTAAGLLKRFFRDLPVFVPQSINKRVVSLFIDEEGKKKPVDMEILSNLRVLVHQLPTVHFEVMQELTNLLGKLMSRSDQNKMTISNIAICLVPTLNCVPAIVTYSIQMHDFFYNEVFPQHHLYYMRPYEEKLVESAPTQPINIMTTSGGEKRYSSRPASITISGLLPSNGQNNSPSSSTITSTTITSPHDSTAPITFTVTTTFSPEQQQQMLQQQQQQQQQQEKQSSSSLSQSQQSIQPISDTNSTKSDRRTFRVDPNLDLTQYIEDTQYNVNRNYLYNGGPSGTTGTTPNGGSLSIGGGNGGNGGSSLSVGSGGGNGGSSLSVGSNTSVGVGGGGGGNNTTDQSKIYRRSVAYTNNEDTKAAIQQIKEKIDRYSKEKKTREEKEREKLLRYSIDLERYKDRTINNKQEKRASRDINKEIEREIEKKRLSPRERLNLFGLSSSSSSVNSTLTRSTANIISTIDGSGGSNRNSKNYGNGSSSSSNRRYSNTINQQLQMQLQQLQIQQQQYQQTQQSQIPLQYQQQQQQQQQQTTTTTTTSSGSNRFSSNRYKPVDLTQSSSNFRYSREIYDDDYYSNNNLMMFGNEQPNQTPISVSSSSAFTRQRSQSCFEPENLVLLQQQYQQYQQQQQQQQQIPFQANPQYSNAVIEQKLDQIRDTINNLHRDNRVSRDYTHYLREVEDLRSSLQKETVVSNEFIKNIELEDKLRREEEKNQRLIEEIHLLETYFILKEKSKAKRLSTTKDLLTRSRSPTLPSSINMSTSSLGSSSSSAYNNNNNNNNVPK